MTVATENFEGCQIARPQRQPLVDESIFLNEGQVISRGTPEEIMNAPELAEIYFGLGEREDI
jgi:ABC-type histidine transport system ATPase subunit